MQIKTRNSVEMNGILLGRAFVRRGNAAHYTTLPRRAAKYLCIDTFVTHHYNKQV
jgi:hypothetical protein